MYAVSVKKKTLNGEKMSILDGVNSPADLKKLNLKQLEELARDIRESLIRTVSRTGGHIASSLGAVELTIALHRVFQSPQDKIVFDVGHQAYAHKILTGRRNQMHTLRQFKGISGFPKPHESEHDAFIAGHASTSISVALGYATADKQQGKDNYSIAVIGDGALTGGMAYEAIGNAGRSKTNLIILLNDNGMAISQTVGSIAGVLTKIRTSRRYFRAKDYFHRFTRKVPLIGKPIDRFMSFVIRRIKGAIYNTTLFEDLNLSYLGPVDGHDINALTVILERAKQLKTPCVVHAVTVKGKGFSAAEHDPVAFHGAPTFNIHSGEFDHHGTINFSGQFGDIMRQMAETDDKLCVITAAMSEGCGLCHFAKQYPQRFYDVGIAEEHAVTFAAGLAAGGMRPVVAMYSTFLQRCADQLIHDVALSGQKVVFAIDRAGLVGADGETHQGLYDLALFRNAGITVLAPSNYAELKTAFSQALYELDGPVAVRYPRGSEPEIILEDTMANPFISLKSGEKTALISHGVTISSALQVSERLDKVAVIKLNRLWPIPSKMIDILKGYDHVIYLSEEEKAGAIGESIATQLSGCATKVHILAPHGFVEQGSIPQLQKLLALDVDSIVEYCQKECFHEHKATT